MILAVDVDYRDSGAVIAGLSFPDWEAAKAAQTHVSHLAQVADYEPGSFYRRELPCILHLLTEHQLQPAYIIIDGFVTLDEQQRPGLGLHLYQALNQQTPIVGVAKNPFRTLPKDCELYRGSSQRPLYVTAAGLPLAQAKTWVHSMHGKHRFPELLRQVDRLARDSDF